jgi:hypothetical protein
MGGVPHMFPSDNFTKQFWNIYAYELPSNIPSDFYTVRQTHIIRDDEYIKKIGMFKAAIETVAIWWFQEVQIALKSLAATTVGMDININDFFNDDAKRLIHHCLQKNDDEDCPICYEHFSPLRPAFRLNECFHKFCKPCLDEVLHNQPYNLLSAPCPLCRTPYDRTDIIRCEVKGLQLSKKRIVLPKPPKCHRLLDGIVALIKEHVLNGDRVAVRGPIELKNAIIEKEWGSEFIVSDNINKERINVYIGTHFNLNPFNVLICFSENYCSRFLSFEEYGKTQKKILVHVFQMDGC